MLTPVVLLQFRSEFKKVIGLAEDVAVHSTVEEWDSWQTRIIEYSKLEKTNRKQLRDLLDSLEKVTSDEMKGVLLYISQHTCITLYMILYTCNCTISIIVMILYLGLSLDFVYLY